jgi:DNA modification methylase
VGRDVTYQLIRGNAMSLPLADESVDLVVTSPPYFALRSYTDGGEHYEGQLGSEATPQAFLEALWAWTAECVRVLKPSGSLWVNLGDKYASAGGFNDGTGKNGPLNDAGRTGGVVRRLPPGIPNKSLMLLPQRYAIGCIDQLGLICRAEVIWSKPNGLPESVTDRVRRSHEQWFHFTKEPRYFSAVDEVREAQVGGGHIQHAKGAAVASDGTRHRAFGKTPEDYNPLGKLPGSVWTVPTEPLRVPDHLGVDHFAAFPSEWPRRIILGWSPSGVCVACGEGRRPVVAKDYTPAGGRGNESYSRDMDDARDDLVAGRPKFQEMPHGRADLTATITGYACACPDTTAPTRPAVVLDPFAGTGTVPAVAHILGRHGIGIDLSADYLRLAEWRCNDPGLRAKVLRVDKPKAVPDGQLDIFGGEAA